MSKLIRGNAFIEDGFVTVADDAPLPDGGAIVSLARFQKDREALLARNAALGVRLQSHESPEALGADVEKQISRRRNCVARSRANLAKYMQLLGPLRQ